MRNLLNNPWFVAALGIFAAAYLGVSLVLPLISEDSPSVADVPPLDLFGDPVRGGDVASIANVTGLQANPVLEGRESIGWLYDIERDPFSGSLLNAEVSEPEVLPSIGALFVGAGVQAAVVNERLVRVGDSIDRFVVVEIGAQHVVLRRGQKEYRLEPAG